MRNFLWFIFLLLSGCADNNHQAASSGPVTNTDTQTGKALSLQETLRDISLVILTSIKERDYKTIANLIHPEDGIRFSPYGYFDSLDVKLDSAAFLESARSQQELTWGVYAGSGEPIQFTVNKYFEEFLWDANFLQPEKFSVDTLYSRSNHSFKNTYPDAHFTESYFSGFDKKYEGMDWRSLMLVYKKFQGDYYVCAIIHDEWTP